MINYTIWVFFPKELEAQWVSPSTWSLAGIHFSMFPPSFLWRAPMARFSTGSSVTYPCVSLAQQEEQWWTDFAPTFCDGLEVWLFITPQLLCCVHLSIQADGSSFCLDCREWFNEESASPRHRCDRLELLGWEWSCYVGVGAGGVGVGAAGWEWELLGENGGCWGGSGGCWGEWELLDGNGSCRVGMGAAVQFQLPGLPAFPWRAAGSFSLPGFSAAKAGCCWGAQRRLWGVFRQSRQFGSLPDS